MAYRLSFIGGGRSSKCKKLKNFVNLEIFKKACSKKSQIFPKSAFSVAEALIALLIVSIVMAATAPLMSKKAARDTQAVSGIAIPKGAVMFFDKNFVDHESLSNPCPTGWVLVDEKYNGRYLKVSGSYNICDKSGEDEDGNCVNKTANDLNTGVFSPIRNERNQAGRIYGDRMRNLWGTYTSYEFGAYHDKYITALGVFNTTGESLYGGNNTSSDRSPVLEFNASNYVPVGDENMPRSISMLTCRKK